MLKKYFIRIVILSSLLFSLPVFSASFASLFRDATDPVTGNPEGKVSVVEFFDYQCIHCINTQPAVDAVINSNPDVRFVFKELPVFGPASVLAAKAALAANMQGKYYAFHTTLLDEKKPITMTYLNSLAKKLGLDLAKFKKDMNSSTVSDKIKTTKELAISAGVRGTPAFFIGKTDAENMDQVTFLLGEATKAQINHAILEASK